MAAAVHLRKHWVRRKEHDIYSRLGAHCTTTAAAGAATATAASATAASAWVRKPSSCSRDMYAVLALPQTRFAVQYTEA